MYFNRISRDSGPGGRALDRHTGYLNCLHMVAVDYKILVVKQAWTGGQGVMSGGGKGTT
jgi:hypothetical protein